MSQPTFQEVSRLWKEDKRQWVKPSTYATYINQLNARLLPVFGPCRPDDITEDAVQQYVNSLLGTLRVGTIRDSLIVLRLILSHAGRHCGWPVKTFRVHFPTAATPARSIPVLSPDSHKKLLAYLKTHFSFRNLGISICLNTGLRIGEVCALQWKDIDVGAGVIHVRKTVQRIWLHDEERYSYTLHVGTPKTPTSRRDVPISQDLMRTLRPLCKVMAADFYIVSNTEKPLEPRYYRDYFRRLLTALQIPPIRFHGLRHSFATRCIESKCDYKAVSAILGHTSIATTLDLYVHPGYAEQKKAIEKMARAVGK